MKVRATVSDNIGEGKEKRKRKRIIRGQTTISFLCKKPYSYMHIYDTLYYVRSTLHMQTTINLPIYLPVCLPIYRCVCIHMYKNKNTFTFLYIRYS